MSKTFSLNPRKPLSEEDARKIEEAIAAKGEGVAGIEPVSPEAREPVSSRAHELTNSESESFGASTIKRPASTADQLSPQELKNSPRPRTPSGKRVREVPVTGVGTLHNPRVRKADGVQTRSTTVHLPVELAKKLAVHCAVNGRRQSEVIAEAVQAMLGS